ncbi:MAG: P-II family nitrogen regulator [Planctomycetota bacterium]
MKYVVAIVPGAALSAVTEQLGRAEIYRLTVSDVEVFDPTTSDPDSGHGRLRLEVAVNDDFLQPAIDAFRAVESAHPDFESFWVRVLPLDEAVRIRTGETGSGAI